MTQPIPSLTDLLAGRRRILVTGGAGFIGGAVVRRLLTDSQALVFNLDKIGYASDLTNIGSDPRHQLLRGYARDLPPICWK
jgi:dTDP-glucose 4,6-dehydratase